MALWKRFWLLGTVIWVAVCILSAATILVFSEAEEASKAIQPLVLAVAVPTVLYGAVWAYLRVRPK
jgi:uncharacterized membrane protein